MDVFFLKLLNMSISAGWLILAVIVLRLFLKKAPKWMTCALWAIVAIRLICPVPLESIFSLIPSTETISMYTVQYSSEPAIDSGVPIINDMLNPIISYTFAPQRYGVTSINPLHAWILIAGIVWANGLVCLLAYALFSYLRVRYHVREAILLEDRIWLCDAVKSPFILGIFSPRIYLPAGMEEGQMQYVLSHEQAHLRRRDHWWKPLGYLLLTVYWFHPLVWAAYILLCRDIELACDEKVIRDLSMEEKKAYSHALVSCSMHRKMVMACPLAFGEVSVKERVKAVLNYKKPAFWVMMGAAAVCVAVAVCFLTNPKSQEQPAETQSESMADIADREGEEKNAVETGETAVADTLDSAQGETTAMTEEEKTREKREIAMEDIRKLAETARELTIADFEEFQSAEKIFPYLLQYQFLYEGQEYSLDINYRNETNTLENIRLVRTADLLSIDIRSGIIDHLITGQVSMSDYMEYELPDHLVDGQYSMYLGDYGGSLFVKEDGGETIYGGAEMLSARTRAVKQTEDRIILPGREEDMVCRIEKTDPSGVMRGIGEAEISMDVFLGFEGTAYAEGGQNFWTALFYKENSSVVYMVFLNSDFYSQEDLIDLADSVAFGDNAFY